MLLPFMYASPEVGANRPASMLITVVLPSRMVRNTKVHRLWCDVYERGRVGVRTGSILSHQAEHSCDVKHNTCNKHSCSTDN